MTTTKTLLKESFNSLHYNKEQNSLIQKFMQVTRCRIWDAIVFLNLADWDYNQAIGTQVLCGLSNLAKKKKNDYENLNRSKSFVYSKRIEFKIPTKTNFIKINSSNNKTNSKRNKEGNVLLSLDSKNSFILKKKREIQRERKRKLEEIKSTSCPNIMKVFKSNKRNSSKKAISRSLTLHEIQGNSPISLSIVEQFITQKPAPRWRHRLTAFTKLDSSLTDGWPSCFKDFNAKDENQTPIRKLVVKRALFDLYGKIHPTTCIKNLQRGLITFMENQRFLNLTNPEQDFYLFVSYDPSDF
ncbi:hypothetical protein M0812_14109 [Anaeramoeba flamelloides]|uniref:Uncharacterized protein n=1 Tax=Anaeramoeba flamelloides TaxID=1746091 RepID=A0AAV7ZHR2_9EUKA|nr:hypothetical protein M0812_14109 [Anaeramoeba flamelloides]